MHTYVWNIQSHYTVKWGYFETILAVFLYFEKVGKHVLCLPMILSQKVQFSNRIVKIINLAQQKSWRVTLGMKILTTVRRSYFMYRSSNFTQYSEEIRAACIYLQQLKAN